MTKNGWATVNCTQNGRGRAYGRSCCAKWKTKQSIAFNAKCLRNESWYEQRRTTIVSPDKQTTLSTVVWPLWIASDLPLISCVRSRAHRFGVKNKRQHFSASLADRRRTARPRQCQSQSENTPRMNCDGMNELRDSHLRSISMERKMKETKTLSVRFTSNWYSLFCPVRQHKSTSNVEKWCLRLLFGVYFYGLWVVIFGQ